MRTTEGVLHRSTIAWLVVCATLVGCSPAPQNGTNTNWVCRVDAECTERDPGSTCQAGFCVNNHSASNASGSTDTTASESSGTTTPGGFESAASNGSRIGGALNAVTSTDDGWFAIGYRNTPDQHALVATSSDARNWKVVDAPGDAYMLTSVAFEIGRAHV